MKTTNIIPATILMTTIAMTGTASAHNKNYNFNHHDSDCNVNLHNGVTVTPNFVKVFDDNKTLYRINKDGAMTVDGKSVDLTSAQQNLSAEYAQGIRDSIPQAIEVAVNAMEVASTGVHAALGAVFGENSDIEYQVTQVIDQAKEKINDNISQSGDEFTIGPDSFNNIEDAFDEEFEQQIEKVAMNSMGSIFSLIGEAMTSGDGNFEQRMEAFGEKMEKMGENLEASMEAQGELLEAQAEQLCKQLKDIDELESELQQQVPQFADMELIDMQNNNRSRSNRHHDQDAE